LELFNAYQNNAVYSSLLSLVCAVCFYGQSHFLNDAIHRHTVEEVIPPNVDVSDFINTLETIECDSTTLDIEDENAVCPICLSPWEKGYTIKVTPCYHFFHEECLSNWLRRVFKCPVCRRDFTADYVSSNFISSNSEQQRIEEAPSNTEEDPASDTSQMPGGLPSVVIEISGDENGGICGLAPQSIGARADDL